MPKKEIKEGDKVYTRPFGNASLDLGSLVEGVVVSVAAIPASEYLILIPVRLEGGDTTARVRRTQSHVFLPEDYVIAKISGRSSVKNECD